MPVCFSANSARATQTDGSSGTIIVTQGKIDNLISAFTGVRQRPPSREELCALIEDYVREEVLYRGAMELGLDAASAVRPRRGRSRNASSVRPRSRQKHATIRGGAAKDTGRRCPTEWRRHDRALVELRESME
jgi:hypothetical protein